MSAIDQITSLLEGLSVSEKMTLIGRIATGAKAAKGAKAKKEKTDDGEAKPKRKAAVGTLAWTAFVKHIKATQPDAFAGITKESDKLQIVKGIRAEDMSSYDAFVANYKADHALAAAAEADAEADAEEAEEEAEAEEAVVAPVAPVKTLTAKEKIAAIKAAKEAKAAPAPAAPAPAAAKEAKAAPAPAPAAAKPVVVKKEVKKAVKPAVKVVKKEELAPMPTMTIGDEAYWHDESTNGLWMKKEGETYSGADWIGYYQPGNEEEPIRYTDSFGDE